MKLLLLLMVCFSVPAQAGVFLTSVILTLQPGGVTYKPTVKWFSSPLMPPSGDLYAQGYGWFGPGSHLVSYADGSAYPAVNWFRMIPNASVPIHPGDTWASVTQRFIAQYGAAGSATDTYGIGNAYKYEGCFAASKFNAAITVGSGTLFYPGSCIDINFTSNQCRINSAGLIDHGAMSVSEVNGHEAKIYAAIDCNSPALVELRIMNANLELGNGISSELFIDGVSGVAAGSSLQYMIVGPRAIEIKSRLSAMAAQAGSFSGSSYVVVEIL